MFGSFSAPTKAVKTGIDNEDCRQKRQEVSVQIRKTKREDNLRKRRMCTGLSEQQNPRPETATTEVIAVITTNLPDMKLAMEAHGNFDRQLAGTRAVRKLLSMRTSPPVQEVVDADVIPLLCSFLAMNDQPDLQFEAAWALTNIGSSDLTSSIFDAGVVPLLVPLLVSNDAQLREQAAWCIGNIAGDCFSYRDAVLSAPGAVDGLLLNIVHPSSQSMLRNVTWTVSNLCRGNKPKPSLDKLAPIVPVLRELVEKCDDEETLVDACWALSYISDGDNEKIDLVVDNGLCEFLVKLLQQDQEGKFVAPCLRTLGNVVTGSDHHTQTALEAGLLRVLPSLLESSRSGTRKEAAWTCSNITAGTRSQIGAFLAMPGLPEAIVEALRSGEWSTQKEAAWAISNICNGGSSEHIQCIVERYKVISPICDLLNCADTRIISIMLNSIEAILKLNANEYVNLIEESDGLEKLESLQNHKDDSIYEQSKRIIENYFGVEEQGEENENLVPNIEGNQFAFSKFSKGSFQQVPEQNTAFNFNFA